MGALVTAYLAGFTLPATGGMLPIFADSREAALVAVGDTAVLAGTALRYVEPLCQVYSEAVFAEISRHGVVLAPPTPEGVFVDVAAARLALGIASLLNKDIEQDIVRFAGITPTLLRAYQCLEQPRRQETVAIYGLLFTIGQMAGQPWRLTVGVDCELLARTADPQRLADNSSLAAVCRMGLVETEMMAGRGESALALLRTGSAST